MNQPTADDSNNLQALKCLSVPFENRQAIRESLNPDRIEPDPSEQSPCWGDELVSYHRQEMMRAW